MFAAVAAAAALAAAAPAATPPAAAPAKTAPAAPKAAPATPTPMPQRVARIAALNKQNGRVQEFAVHPGSRVAYGRLAINVRACETTPPWERPSLSGAFVQIDDVETKKRLFSGWLFAETPSLNSFDNPVYDVWVRSCTMSFPETGPDTIVPGKSKPDPESSAPKSASTASATDSKPR